MLCSRFLEEEDSCDYVTRLAATMHLHKCVVKSCC